MKQAARAVPVSIVAVVALVLGGLFGLVITPSAADTGTAADWVDDEGNLVVERIPEFIGVTDGSNEVVGFVSREDLYPELFREQRFGEGPPSPDELNQLDAGGLPVVDEDGNVVGSLPTDGSEFVPAR